MRQQGPSCWFPSNQRRGVGVYLPMYNRRASGGAIGCVFAASSGARNFLPLPQPASSRAIFSHTPRSCPTPWCLAPPASPNEAVQLRKNAKDTNTFRGLFVRSEKIDTPPGQRLCQRAPFWFTFCKKKKVSPTGKRARERPPPPPSPRQPRKTHRPRQKRKIGVVVALKRPSLKDCVTAVHFSAKILLACPGAFLETQEGLTYISCCSCTSKSTPGMEAGRHIEGDGHRPAQDGKGETTAGVASKPGSVYGTFSLHHQNK